MKNTLQDTLRRNSQEKEEVQWLTWTKQYYFPWEKVSLEELYSIVKCQISTPVCSDRCSVYLRAALI